ncbi:hypothetical protein ACQUW5_14745 [Legionella sp. CNM-1927-20]|uniref:hypothetical protein n=1 Tax=Legionella sp. CNM-1927-20 TaxID=3422221 RepID=UPI00403AD8F9
MPHLNKNVAEAEKLIDNIRKRKPTPVPQMVPNIPDFDRNKETLFNIKTFEDAKAEVSKAILEYVKELEKDLKLAEETNNREAISKTLNSLRILSLTISGYDLLNDGLKLMHGVNEIFTGRDRADYNLLADLGKDVIKTAQNFNALLDDSSKSLGNKVWLTMKAYASAVVSGIEGFFKGAERGAKKGEGLIDAISNMGQTSVAQGWASFYKKFAEELGKATQKVVNEPATATQNYREALSSIKLNHSDIQPSPSNEEPSPPRYQQPI